MVDVFVTPYQVDELSLRDRTVVVVDVLRASSTIATALSNGAREFIPVTTIEKAVQISAGLFGEATLRGGERNGRMIDGFNLGNSPLEYTEANVKGKAIIFSSTNGSVAIERARYAKLALVGGFVNMSQVVAALVRADPTDISIICAGNSGLLSLEDTLCAGMLVKLFTGSTQRSHLLGDGAVAATALYRAAGRNIVKALRSSDHGRHLAEIGFEADIAACAGVDSVPVVPYLAGKVVRLRPDPETGEVPAPSATARE